MCSGCFKSSKRSALRRHSDVVYDRNVLVSYMLNQPIMLRSQDILLCDCDHTQDFTQEH